MDHLQRLYWSQYRRILESIKHGRLEEPIERCLELLLEPELNLHLRAMLNVTIARYGTFERHPNKADFAEEAIRVSRQMQEATEGEGIRAQATVRHMLFLANQSLEIVKDQALRREARLNAGTAHTQNGKPVVEQPHELSASQGAASYQRASPIEDTVQTTTAATEASDDSDLSMRSSPPPYDEQETPRAIGSQFPLHSSDDEKDSILRDSRMDLDPEDQTSTPKATGFNFGLASDDDNMSSDSDIQLPPQPPVSQKLTLLQKSRLPTPETSDIPQPPSSDM